MDLSNIVVISNRHICYESNGGESEISALLSQLEEVCKYNPKFVVLREKDLSAREYGELFDKARLICDRAGVKLVLHNFSELAIDKGYRHIHMPLYKLQELVEKDKNALANFDTIGASIHSVEDLKLAELLGATYVTAGHVFATDCKKGLPPRGTEFLENICKNTDLDVYAIGGITFANLGQVMELGAKGGCMMSSLMKAL